MKDELKYKLRGQADEIWAKIIKIRDNDTCVLCGSKEHLQAHHAFRTKGSSFALRYDSRNGVTLCRGCHFKAHNNQNADFLSSYLSRINVLIPFDIQELLIENHKAGIGGRFTFETMTQIVADLKAEFEKLSAEQITFADYLQNV